MRSVLAVVTGAAALILVNLAIVSKERLLADGRIVYLELAPVDPRSLMQGDYMALQFRLATDANPSLKKTGDSSWRLATADGRIVVALDDRSIARFQRVDDGRPLAPNEIALRYRVREGRLRFATDAFFFQEGDAERYTGARYGEFRVGDAGDLLLTGLRGRDLQPLGATNRTR